VESLQRKQLKISMMFDENVTENKHTICWWFEKFHFGDFNFENVGDLRSRWMIMS